MRVARKKGAWWRERKSGEKQDPDVPAKTRGSAVMKKCGPTGETSSASDFARDGHISAKRPPLRADIHRISDAVTSINTLSTMRSPVNQRYELPPVWAHTRRARARARSLSFLAPRSSSPADMLGASRRGLEKGNRGGTKPGKKASRKNAYISALFRSHRRGRRATIAHLISTLRAALQSTSIFIDASTTDKAWKVCQSIRTRVIFPIIRECSETREAAPLRVNSLAGSSHRFIDERKNSSCRGEMITRSTE